MKSHLNHDFLLQRTKNLLRNNRLHITWYFYISFMGDIKWPEKIHVLTMSTLTGSNCISIKICFHYITNSLTFNSILKIDFIILWHIFTKKIKSILNFNKTIKYNVSNRNNNSFYFIFYKIIFTLAHGTIILLKKNFFKNFKTCSIDVCYLAGLTFLCLIISVETQKYNNLIIKRKMSIQLLLLYIWYSKNFKFNY